MKQIVFCALMLLVWLALTWSVTISNLAAGIFFSIVVAALLSDIYPDSLSALVEPHRWFWTFVYIPYLFLYIVKANLDVAYRVLHPDVPIHPGIVRVRTTLIGDIGKTALANSLTLTPGTLSVDIIDEYIYVHWINVSARNHEEQTEIIVTRFERILKKIFE